MGLFVVWSVVFGYFLLLWFATDFKMALFGSVLWVLIAVKITVLALRISRDHPQQIPEPDQPQAANQNHPPW